MALSARCAAGIEADLISGSVVDWSAAGKAKTKTIESRYRVETLKKFNLPETRCYDLMVSISKVLSNFHKSQMVDMFSPRFSFSAFRLVILFVLVCSAASIAYSSSTVSGAVFDNNRNPVDSVDVELLNENYSLLLKTRTNGVGRYEFNNLPDGRYYIRVLPFRYNLEDQTQEVVITTLSLVGNGVSFQTLDFILRRRKGDNLTNTTTAVVFAQEVPQEAELLYKEGVEAFDDGNKAKGTERLVAAINLFPTYFAAQQRLGTELLTVGQYLEAAKLFIRAAEINPKSTATFYNLGIAFNNAGAEYNKAALVALKKAGELAPASYQVELQIGRIQRQEGEFGKAEEHLLNAKKLTDKDVPEIHIELAQLYANDLKQFGKAANELELYLKASKKKDEKIKKQIEDLRKKAKRSS
jgi:tetratricopeptide (TPR) repeat protein